ncbi:MAG TPA: hypothetical protein DD706_19110 [Nitrospiraceae bacterium]|nr:hypothetical protein [Nitrospiraceae bacterium]
MDGCPGGVSILTGEDRQKPRETGERMYEAERDPVNLKEIANPHNRSKRNHRLRNSSFQTTTSP